MKLRRVVLIAVFFAGLLSQTCMAQELTVAAAADLQFAMQDIGARFQKETGKTLKVIYGSSGNFFHQIQNGAPFFGFFFRILALPPKHTMAGFSAPVGLR